MRDTANDVPGLIGKEITKQEIRKVCIRTLNQKK